MFPRRFAYHRPATLGEAVELLTLGGGETKILAGGQSLIPLTKLRLISPARLLDIGRLPGLQRIQIENGLLRIGALTRHADMEKFSTPPGLELLSEAARVIGDAQVRNMGTIGGALAQVDPAGDWGTVLLALTTSVVCRSAVAERVVPLQEFFVDAYTPALSAEEILTEVRIALPPEGSGAAYIKLERKAGDFAIASAAVMLRAGAKGMIENIGVGLGGVGLTPIKAVATENFLRGKEFGEEIVAQAAATLGGEINPLSDLRGSEDYKREIAQVLFRRAISSAWRRAYSRTSRSMRPRKSSSRRGSHG